MTCTECDLPVRSLGLCNSHYRKARRARATTQRTTDRLNEVQHLIDGGVWPPNAVKRCEWTLTGAEKAARVAGRDQLANTLRPHISETRAPRGATA